MPTNHFDLIVIGSGPAGQKAAIAAAKLRKRAAVVERRQMLGGVSVHTGTIPSKTLREAVLYLTGFRQRSFYGRDYSLKADISIQDLAFRVDTIVARETQMVQAHFRRNQVEYFEGTGRFRDPHTIEVLSEGGNPVPLLVEGEHILIACGTRPAHSPTVPIDGERILDTDSLPKVRRPSLPRNTIVVGGGVVGLEYASILAALDIKVTLIEQRPTLLDFVDKQIIDALSYHLSQARMIFRLGEKVVRVGIEQDRDRVFAELESGKVVHGDGLLYAVGRQANTDLLNLEAAGLKVDERGRLKVNENFQTEVPHIYAAGDVIGFPALASTSMEQGRMASSHMFGQPFRHVPGLIPYGIYTIPEISMVGKTEEQLTAAKIPYEVGVAKYEDVARGQMMGDQSGMLKLLFDPATRNLLGRTPSGIRRRSTSTSVRPCWRTVAPSITSGIPYSIIRHSRKRTRSRRSTGSTGCSSRRRDRTSQLAGEKYRSMGGERRSERRATHRAAMIPVKTSMV